MFRARRSDRADEWARAEDLRPGGRQNALEARHHLDAAQDSKTVPSVPKLKRPRACSNASTDGSTSGSPNTRISTAARFRQGRAVADRLKTACIALASSPFEQLDALIMSWITERWLSASASSLLYPGTVW